MSASLPPRRSIVPGAGRSLAPGALRSLPPGVDAYADLLRETRGLHREHAQAREAWLSRLALERREDTLFELEVLLKGLACFANPRNHPGPPRKAAVVAQDYREPLVVAREGLQRVLQLARVLLGERERAFVFQRYLEMQLTDDATRSKLQGGAGDQHTPEESLFVLRQSMTHLHEVTAGVARLPRVPFRLFYSTLSLAQREIAQSRFFNPLVALEFRPEFDRITNPRLLELMRQVPGERARRLVALTFLSLFRMLRYLALVEHSAREARRPAGVTYLVLATLRSDARALTGYLRSHAGEMLSESFEQEIFRVPAREIRDRYEGLMREAHGLLEIKAAVGGVSANLRLELRRAFEHEFPAPDGPRAAEELRAALSVLIANLRPALQNAVLVLGRTLGARLDEHGVFDDAAARRALSERLRRDVWMFAQIVRAFGSKAAAAPQRDERWSGPSSLQFVREFMAYFRSMGYPLLRAADYPRVDAFIAALSALEEGDLANPLRLERAVDEAGEFYLFLSELFEHIGHRDELRGVPFDRKAAAAALKLYLGD